METKDILPELNRKQYITELNELYDIHFCSLSEVDELTDFIDKFWKRNHIFVLDRGLLDWQHYDSINSRYNFVIAKHKESREIHSILGFVPTYQFDHKIQNIEVWLCIWKTRDDVQSKGLGASLVYYLKTNLKIETISQLGISEVNMKICKHWGFKTGIADHYYLPNMNVDNVLTAGRKYNPGSMESDTCNIQPITNEEFSEFDMTPFIASKTLNLYKSKDYYINRYFKHPYYKYKFYIIKNMHNIDAILITRECGAFNRKCVRIIDVIGDIRCLKKAHNSILKLLENNQYEYMDFLSAGIHRELLDKIGFTRRQDNNTIIPNYFEPFLKSNIELKYAIKTINTFAEVQIFKGDSDQDRPNVLPC